MSEFSDSATDKGWLAPASGLLPFVLAMWLPGFTTLPPMDRDGPRFAQASKQMLETGEVVSIRFGEEARNKRPVGIHWLQAAAVGAGEVLGVGDARRQIWSYRVPSLAAALATVFLTVWAAVPLVPALAALVLSVLARSGAWLKALRPLPGFALLLAWLVPSWPVYEAVRTELFHYVMPLYPALAILAVVGWSARRPHVSGMPPAAPRVFAALLALVPVLAAAAAPALAGRLRAVTPAAAVRAALTTLCGPGLATLAASASATPVAALAFGLMLSPAMPPSARPARIPPTPR